MANRFARTIKPRHPVHDPSYKAKAGDLAGYFSTIEVDDATLRKVLIELCSIVESDCKKAMESSQDPHVRYAVLQRLERCERWRFRTQAVEQKREKRAPPPMKIKMPGA